MKVTKKRGGRYSVKFAGKEAANNLRARNNTLSAPNVQFNAETNDELFCLVIYDPDAPNPSYLHWLVINIPEENVDNGDTIMTYTPPSPPSGTHKYYVVLYKQPGIIKVNPFSDRAGFSIEDFVNTHSLEERGRKMIQVAHTN